MVQKEQLSKRWKDYYEELLNVENESNPLFPADPVHGPDEDVTLDEVKNAIKSRKTISSDSRCHQGTG